MKCPKCGHQQTNTEECEACGIFFAKYKKLQQQTTQQVIHVERKRSYTLPIVISVVAGILIGAYFFQGSEDSAPTRPKQAATGQALSPDASAKQLARVDDQSAQSDNPAPRNEIERARSGTVFIQTEWGLGSGFFFSADCRILTNRHVIELSSKQVAKIQAEFDRREKYLDSVKAEIERRKHEFNLHCNKCDTQEYHRYIGAVEDKYKQAERELQVMEDKLFALRNTEDIQVIMANGAKIPASVINISENYDLALLKLQEDTKCAKLSPGLSKSLKYGDPLYTIGNPIGLKLVVTSGIFSGYTDVKGVTMIQTDAPINPGNSGGPLIDAKGKVYGINTAILTNAEGIGFALPIELAESEFGL